MHQVADSCKQRFSWKKKSFFFFLQFANQQAWSELSMFAQHLLMINPFLSRTTTEISFFFCNWHQPILQTFRPQPLLHDEQYTDVAIIYNQHQYKPVLFSSTQKKGRERWGILSLIYQDTSTKESSTQAFCSGESLSQKKKSLFHVTWEIYLCKGHKVSALIKTNKKKTSFKVVLKNQNMYINLRLSESSCSWFFYV